MATMEDTKEKAKQELKELIQTVTSPLQNDSDSQSMAIESIKIMIRKEGELINEFKARIIEKLASLNATETLKALDLLDECMIDCGYPFHRSIGQFRFLNELMQLVLPNHKGNDTPKVIKNKIIRLLTVWQIQYPTESKIFDAYQMLERAGVKYELQPKQHAGNDDVSCLTNKATINSDQFAEIPQKLLLSKDPQDVETANFLIERIVRKNERKIQLEIDIKETMRKSRDNGNLLSEMLKAIKLNEISEDEKDTLKELYRTCKKVMSTISLQAQNEYLSPELVGDLFTVNDMLRNVCTDYLNMRLENDTAAVQSTSEPVAQSQQQEQQPSNSDLLADIFKVSTPMPEIRDNVAIVDSPVAIDSTNDILCRPNELPSNRVEFSILQPMNFPVDHVISKENESVMEQDDSADMLLSEPTNVTVIDDVLASPIGKQTTLDQDVEAMVAKLKLIISKQTSVDKNIVNSNDQSPIIEIVNIEPVEIEKITTAANSLPVTPPALPHPPLPISTQEIPLSKLTIDINTIKPSTELPRTIYNDPQGLKIVLQFSVDRPRENMSVIVVNTTNQSTKSISKYQFDASVSKPCKIFLLEASGSDLPGVKPFRLPTENITQIILISNKEKTTCSLTCIISYCIEDELDPIKESIRVDNLPYVEN